MHFIYYSLLKTYMKSNRYFLFFKHSMRNTPFLFCEDYFEHQNKPKQKVTVVKRKIFENKQISTAVEWKSAADVIKKLNLEYKYLYGPVQTSNVKLYNLREIYESDEIIQHETRIPIIEPQVDCKNTKHSTMQNEEQKFNLHSILTFPMLNKLVHSTNKINEANFLRKHLQYLCKNSSVPNVEHILQKTMSQERVEILDRLNQNKINQLGKEGYDRLQTEKHANGNSLHHNISSFLCSTPESELHIKEENIGHWESLKHILPDIKDVKLLEEFVTHPFLCYKGVVDCFAKYKDQLVVIEWKTSKKSKSQIKNTYDDPLQIAAYVGALNFDPKFQYLASKGLLVIAYENGMTGTVHFINEDNMNHYWNEWLKRVKLFWEMKISETKSS